MASVREPTANATTGEDAINRIAGITAESPLGRLRAEKPDVVRFAQGSYEALLEPHDPAGVSRHERELVAFRVAVLTPDPALAAWHRGRLRDMGAMDAALDALERFPDGGVLSPREAAIIRHTDRLTLAPGAAGPAHIAELKASGLGPRDIVTIAQLIAFLSFQVRALAALRILGENA